jgi:hypothetical protein
MADFYLRCWWKVGLDRFKQHLLRLLSEGPGLAGVLEIYLYAKAVV